MDWVKEFDGAVTICDRNFIIVYMNDRSVEEFAKYGGADLIGENLLHCHNSNSARIMQQLLDSGTSHSYTKVKKDGRTKVIHQSPWIKQNQIKGLVEISFYLNP